ncbi:glycosyl transferase [Mycolicibacterium duvalii]|uniref:Glycosyl transferase n=1 Tax=Mycolicibacterium duvalii TaxID=39688 RepID=A0A7I7K719_9MYCO|nr:glycosyltransferase [Mycolicibacterium duvalii]MCV7370683.1 glycosyltransferase family 1 protein [Mycolicibacterium duvalii]PEG36076.1 glycosyl transferase [Mycolicibacterium duvalii]BBX19364.1 glycosyl transferase [Mycolicibacterium duvalii]
MAVVLAYMSPALGHLFPFCALLGELARRGHEIHVRTLASGVALCREQGFDARPVDSLIEGLQTLHTTTNVLQSARETVDVLTRRAELEIDDFCCALADVDPDVVIVDANCWGAMSVAETQNRPWVALSPFIPYLRSPGSPPFGAGARPWPGPFGRIRDLGVGAVTSLVFDVPLRRGIGPVRAALGLPPVHSADELLRRAPKLLVATAKPFEYPHTDWGDTVEMIGPAEFDLQRPAPAWLTEIDQPVVLVTTSSVPQADDALIHTAIEAFHDEPVHVVITAPTAGGAATKVADNVTLSGFVPHSVLLERAVCVITHGGLGITQKALARGIPVCAVPYGRDQFEVARRVEVAAAGVRLPAGRLSPGRLRDAVQTARTMGAGAAAVAAGFAACGGVARGADLVEQQVREAARTWEPAGA